MRTGRISRQYEISSAEFREILKNTFLTMAKKWSEKFKTISKKAAKLSQANRKLLLKREHVLYSTFQGKQDQAFNSQELDQYGVGFWICGERGNTEQQ